MKVLVGILVCLILGTILVSVGVAQPIDRTFDAESYNSNIEAPMELLSANAKSIFLGNFSFGVVYPGAIIEAGVRIPATKVYSSESSSWIEILDIEENIHRTYGNFSIVDFSIKPKITSGQVLGDITLVTNEGTFCIGITGEVRSYPISRVNLLIAETPFDAYGSENSRLKRMIESNNINVSYMFKLPGNIDSFDAIIIGQGCLVEGCRECLNTNEISRLKDFVRNGGTLIIFADSFFIGSVEGANKIIMDFGLRMEDREYYEDISVDKNNIATDPITKNIDDVVFWRPTPIFVDSSSKAKILVTNPERSDEGFVAVSRNEGTIYVIGNSLYSIFLYGGKFSKGRDNTELLVNMIVSAKHARTEEEYTFVAMWPELPQPWYFSSPSDIAVDSSGNVFVAEFYNNRIQKFDADGNFITKWGSSGTGDGQFDGPCSIAVDSSGNVFVSDFGNVQIQKFGSYGNFITKWGSPGTGDGEFDHPSGIAVDSSGNVFVSDLGNHRIQKFDSNGNFITKWGSQGTGDEEFDSGGIAVDGSGNVYVGDYGNNRIQKFDADGNFITKWGSYGTGDGQFENPTGIAVDSSGNVFVADWLNNRIQKFDSFGNFITTWGSEGTGDGEFDSPEGIAVDSSGNVFVADSFNDRIQKFDPYGSFITKWSSQGTGDGEFDWPVSIAVDGSSNVFVADSGNDRIQKFGSYGDFITKWGGYGTGDGEFDHPSGIAVDSSAQVYVVDSGNNRIQKFDSFGNFITKWGSQGTGEGEFNRPEGIAVDSSGNVFVVDRWNDRIQKFDSFGNFITKWGSEGTGDGEFDHPSGIAVDSSGNVFVADSGNDRIQNFDSFGNFITKWGCEGTGDGEFDRPWGIAVDSNGNVFVADTRNDRIQKFVPGILEHPDWTFMVYMGADNSMKGDANMDVKEMEEAGSTDEVNIVYLLDKTNSNTVIYRITGDYESEPKKEYTKNKNSGDPNTLKDFINWVGSNYPAQHYCLVLWDHGYGWKGVVMDETEKEDKITLEELKNALDTSKIDKFDVIGFDACLMGGVEVDYQIKENSEYIVHSEETIEKGGGWPYDEI